MHVFNVAIKGAITDTTHANLDVCMIEANWSKVDQMESNWRDPKILLLDHF
jgi:hypothetical protein